MKIKFFIIFIILFSFKTLSYTDEKKLEKWMKKRETPDILYEKCKFPSGKFYPASFKVSLKDGIIYVKQNDGRKTSSNFLKDLKNENYPFDLEPIGAKFFGNKDKSKYLIVFLYFDIKNDNLIYTEVKDIPLQELKKYKLQLYSHFVPKGISATLKCKRVKS